MLTEVRSKHFTNGSVHLLRCGDGALVETTDTFLPFSTICAVGYRTNVQQDGNPLDRWHRSNRWMIGVSTQSGCPVRCKFCATGKMKSWRNLTAEEMVEQVAFILLNNAEQDARHTLEFKINWTRMGEPFLNIEEVRRAMAEISKLYPKVHHYISTIGIKGSDFSWIEGNTTLQFSVHSFDEAKRDWLIPFPKKMTLQELGQVRTQSDRKTTINMTLIDESDFDIDKLKEWFDPTHFFVKLSPINPNCISAGNGISEGAIHAGNII